jgi:hypothetical protein
MDKVSFSLIFVLRTWSFNFKKYANQMDRYKYKSIDPERSSYVYSYSLPAAICLKEMPRTKKKRRHLNRFLITKNKTTITNTLPKYEISSTKPVEVKKAKSSFNLYDKDKILGSKKLKKLNCCKIS